MLDDEKLLRLRVLVNDANIADEMLMVYLDMAKEKILNRLYPMQDISKLNESGELVYKMPSKYDSLHVELASRYVFRRGFEGQIGSSENGINRQFGSANDEDLLKEVVQVVGVL